MQVINGCQWAPVCWSPTGAGRPHWRGKRFSNAASQDSCCCKPEGGDWPLQQSRRPFLLLGVLAATDMAGWLTGTSKAGAATQASSFPPGAVVVAPIPVLVPGAPAPAAPLPASALEQPLVEYWNDIRALVRQRLGADFQAELLFYRGPDQELPLGSPGDPQMDYQSRKSGACGTFSSGAPVPYPVCPPPGGLPVDVAARDCCRHFAYCVPRTRLSFEARDRVTTVVVAPRIALLEPPSWRAMLAHEMGHVIDFHIFGARYMLTDHPPKRDPELLALLRPINSERDPELRADMLANALVAAPQGEQVCYDPRTTLQLMVSPAESCTGTGEAGDLRRLAHFTHPPTSGRAPK